jgi:protocatechuate 3,4-dioxygenase, beta subunit
MHKRRQLLFAGAAISAASVGLPAWPQTRSVLPAMTEGPFYPPLAWRQRWDDWDADLTEVRRGSQTLSARGEHLALDLSVSDTQGRVIDRAEVEIWQCDALASYHHPSVRVAAGQIDPGFQGFGAARAGSDGALVFKTIKPVAYPGRSPHIHIRLRHASFGEHTSQLFIAGNEGNARDGLWRSLSVAQQAAAAMLLQPAPADSGLRWQVRQMLVLPA